MLGQVALRHIFSPFLNCYFQRRKEESGCRGRMFRAFWDGSPALRCQNLFNQSIRWSLDIYMKRIKSLKKLKVSHREVQSRKQLILPWTYNQGGNF